jgi:hypothetical protein
VLPPASLHGIDETQALKTCLQIDETFIPLQFKHKVSNINNHHQLHIAVKQNLLLIL